MRSIRLFIETDSPYLAPVPHRGKTNTPAWVSIVGEFVAQKLHITSADLALAIKNNFQRLFLNSAFR